ncbi:glycoside hydrolase family 3 protein [Cantharellus anzutake]|uniref:glycoside hydrolase family 3 protein n=1 Tax=Cantharellus anzutake TaxID=1750568 RepID=UPI001907FA65|nr:glycoside hydrolase family 3 protein [Cantharellus anzutake]KAF8321393.1 glycoside hydrolase family 3 protein [Cantharellus anzutake]
MQGISVFQVPLSHYHALSFAGFPDCTGGPLASNLVCNSSVHYLDRAKALVSEFTVEELINNSVHASPGVQRLGLPAYNWWNEALHGVAWSPGVWFDPPNSDFSHATSFPQPILMGATFDDELVHSVADIVSTEARAFNNFGHGGLDFWTPNINPFKDPRWGRGQETPGEDPYHLSRYVYSLVTGLQGGVDPKPYLKTAADCKHFAAYDLEDWGGINRFNFDAIVTQQDLAEYYSPPFQSCVRDAKVASVMCSYNSVNGIPSCASPYLLQRVIREFYGLGNETWIVSDCGAVGVIHNDHKYSTSLAHASAVALKAGTDIDCGTVFSNHLGEAIDQKLITISHIQTALVRQYASLVRLGYFDSPSFQPYRQLTWKDVNTPKAQTLAYTAAVEGIVLLKNTGILPLSTDVHNIALIGPLFNTTTQMQGNYNGRAPFLVSPFQAFRSTRFNVTYSIGTNILSDVVNGTRDALAIAARADVVIYLGGIDNDVEAEGKDRVDISWPDNQFQLISALESTGKPLIVVQMGGGQVDDSALAASESVKGLLWAGYPGQSGGQAIVDIITGKRSPAGRLPITQYPTSYVSQVPMTNMNLRPDSISGSPGRTYKWYTGTPVFEFGFGLHYTTFHVSWFKNGIPKPSYSISTLVSYAKTSPHLDLGLLDSFKLNVHNTGKASSDYVALLFLRTTAGPSPAPLKQLVSYARAKNLSPGQVHTLTLNVTLGSIARVESNGDSVLYPGNYELWVDVGSGLAKQSFTLTGRKTRIIAWPQHD